MATRATYSFDDRYNDQFTFYIHWDGYPEGAARYFWNMHQHSHYKGELADCFIKGNLMSAEVTRDHECHRDTDYRYYMTKDSVLMAIKVIRFDNNSVKVFEKFFHGHYAEFINLYNRFLLEENSSYEWLYPLSTDVASSYSATKRYMTVSEIKRSVLDYYEHVLDGHKQYQSYLDRWVTEYQRIKAIAARK